MLPEKLLDELQKLNRAEKLQAMRFLVEELAAEEGEATLDLDTKEGLTAAFRESWRQAMEGNTRPVSELWDELAPLPEIG